MQFVILGTYGQANLGERAVSYVLCVGASAIVHGRKHTEFSTVFVLAGNVQFGPPFLALQRRSCATK